MALIVAYAIVDEIHPFGLCLKTHEIKPAQERISRHLHFFVLPSPRIALYS
jgi:hypothetical protein